MHFLAKRGVDLAPLHEASHLQKTDTVHGAFVGLALGGLLGALAGAFLVYFPPQGGTMELFTILATAIVGAAVGTWISAMVGLQVPNSRLKVFEKDIEEGRVLLMLDVPAGRHSDIAALIERTHPEAADRGVEPTVPAFP